MAADPGSLDRSHLLSGAINLERRARRTGNAIESRVLFTRTETRRALDAFLLGESDQFQRRFNDYLGGLRERARGGNPLLPGDLERFTDQWESLLPPDPDLRAAVALVVSRRVSLSPDGTPRALSALSGGDSALAEALCAAAPGAARLTELAAAPVSAIDEVEPWTQWIRVSAGEELFAAGTNADAVYFVVNGSLATASAAEEATVGPRYRRGDVCGDVSVITGEPHATTVIALRDSELLLIPADRLLEAARRHPDVLLRLTRTMAARLRSGNVAEPQKRTAPGRTLALLPGHAGAPVAAIARDLSAAVGKLGSVLHVTEADVLRRFGEAGVRGKGAEESELIAWLSEQETEKQYLVFECHELDSPWARRVARQADRVVFVADALHKPLTALPEIPGLARRPVVDLLLVHSSDVEQPIGTANWPRPSEPGFVLHWRETDDSQTRSVARRLAGQGIGVVMSGGGARGYAHIGVARALEEAGIEVDTWAGASMGALMAGGFALRRPAEEMRTRALESASRRHLLDITPPFIAFARGRKVTDLLVRETKNLLIEDLWRGYFAVATNLSRSTLVNIDQGPLWYAIRASIALPGLYPPVPSAEGDLLVDGALINNMPIDLMRARDDVGTVIGINISPAREPTRAWDYGPWASGWPQLLAAMRIPVRRRVPGIVATMLRSTLASGSLNGRSPEFIASADLIIEPLVHQFGILQFSACDRLITAGYESGQNALTDCPVTMPEMRG